MATNIEIKEAIDTDITNKTLPSSVTNTNVGARMKSVVDYIDQEITNISPIQKIIKVSLSSADILALNTTPITVISGIPNTLIALKSIRQRYIHNTTAYTHTGFARFAYGVTTNWQYATSPLIQSAQNTYGIQDFSLNTSTSNNYEGEDVIFFFLNPATLGNGILEIYITYEEITII